jgi:hypothetical protein
MKRFVAVIAVWAIAAICIVGLSGCRGEPIARSTTNNQGFEVQFLFEFEGCRFYRFDDFRAVYFMKCDDKKHSISWVESCGKACTRVASMLIPE